MKQLANVNFKQAQVRFWVIIRGMCGVVGFFCALRFLPSSLINKHNIKKLRTTEITNKKITMFQH